MPNFIFIRRNSRFISSILFVAAICSVSAEPDTSSVDTTSIGALDKITVIGKKGDILQKVTGEQSRVVDPSQMAVTRAINLVPSISQQSVDPYGLADISNYHESFRFRGVEATSGGVPASPINVEDVPVTGRPGGGAVIYDLENFRDVIVYSGGIPADKGCGIANVGGKINLRVQRPGEDFGITAKQALGSSKFFRRTFLRVNSGEHFSTKGFASYSNTFYDKWKGYGNTSRNNVMVGLTTSVKDRITIEAFGIYNKLRMNTYRPLSFAQVSDMNANYKLDFSKNVNPGSLMRNFYIFNNNKWPALCIASVIIILMGYLLLVLSNTVYLGWGDSLYFFSHPKLWRRLALTAWTATLATGLSLTIGIPAGYALSRFRLPFPRLMSTLIDLPILIPAAAVGAFLFGFTHKFPFRDILTFFGISLGHTTAGVVFAQFMVTVAFCSRLMKSTFDTINPRFELVSRSLGASRVRTFFQITLPLASRGIPRRRLRVIAE